MTNPTIIDIHTCIAADLAALNLKGLQSLAKELKVKNWWTMKKADLLTIITDLVFEIQAQEAQAQAQENTPAEVEVPGEAPTPEEGEEIYKDEKVPTPSKAPQAEKAQKKAKASKKDKTPKVEKNEENIVTLKELASEFKMKGTKARRLLRNETAARPFGGNRWEWDKDLHKEELEAARSILKAHTK